MSKIKPSRHKKFGTFLGVFTPSVLTILGLIMYLRFGWVIGNVGLGWTLVIVILASTITFITGLSASAIATNMNIGAGGEYYMVSRSLGIELGGAIGIPLYFCRTLSITFYCFGLAEALLLFWPLDWGPIPFYADQVIAAGIILLITLVSSKSVEFVLKSQIPILILVGLSILVLMVGALSGPIKPPSFEASYTTAPGGFWYVFAVFFPAVTGFTAGIGMSGDLKDSKKSIPTGTLGAILVCLLIYLLIPVVLALSDQLGSTQLLDAERGITNWTSIAFFGGVIVVPAVLGAILSSAIGSILNGPRVLQALSTDGMVPKKFSKLSKSGQPTLATWVTGFIALLAVLLGGLNTVAILVSVLFLTLYVAINFSAALEVIVADPHYRPDIKVPWYISLIGALGAVFVMILISPLASVIALSLEVLIYFYLRRKSLEQNWGDVGSGFLLNVAKRALLNHNKRKRNPRNWRPQTLLFVGDIEGSIQLIKLGAAISENHGVLTVCHLVTLEEHPDFDSVENLRLQMQEDIQKYGLEVFCEVNIVPDIRSGTLQVAKAHGIAGLKSNTIMEGVSRTVEGRVSQLIKLNEMAKAGKNIIYARFNTKIKESLKNTITIWWRGKESNVDLMLLLAYLIELNIDYQQYKVEIISIVKDVAQVKELKHFIKKQLDLARITAKVDILVSLENINTLIKDRSKGSKIVMLGLPTLELGEENKKARWIEDISIEMATVLFVYNAGMANAIPKLL